eukprot:TRINITY_DN1616_c1_g1_i6.p1 TRINITY_DN1616_c1_g1~~TRINITY_DN1616_c1_g1_i6.p1  ORF type:complete len:146 (+),score=32.25 TRINITY_DN1616_c1_g1_i6:87-524(+)
MGIQILTSKGKHTPPQVDIIIDLLNAHFFKEKTIKPNDYISSVVSKMNQSATIVTYYFHNIPPHKMALITISRDIIINNITWKFKTHWKNDTIYINTFSDIPRKHILALFQAFINRDPNKTNWEILPIDQQNYQYLLVYPTSTPN